MKKVNIYRFLYAVSALLVLGFAIHTIVDGCRYNSMLTSFPFYAFVLVHAIAEMYPYINAKIFSAMSGMYPSFDGKSPYYSVLGTYYVSLAQDIWLNKDWTDEKMQKAIDLFEDATLDLEELSFDILEMSEERKDKMALRKIGSPIYNEAEKMVKEYCNKYGKLISTFNQSH